MPDLQHSSLPSSGVHEPKHITINGPSASGNVITNSASTSGVSEYRRLKRADIDELQETWHVLELDASVAQTHYIPAIYNGTIVGFAVIVNSAVAGASNTYELRIDGVTVTGSPLTITTAPGSGGTAGDIITSSPSSANTFATGQTITINNTSLGNTDPNVDPRFAILVQRA